MNKENLERANMLSYAIKHLEDKLNSQLEFISRPDCEMNVEDLELELRERTAAHLENLKNEFEKL